jgi:hypothetical protein
MASSSAVPAPSREIRLKHVLFVALALLFAFVLWHDERFIFDHSHPSWAYYLPVRWFIIPHGLAGLTALLIGPFQLSTRFRQQHLRIHRIMGRVYLSSVAIAGCMGMYLAYIHQELLDKIWVFALALTWLLTGAMAFAAVLNGNIVVHRQWMVRNYAITTAFVTTRIATALPFVVHGGDGLIRVTLWIVLLATVVLAEVVLSWRAVFANRRPEPAASMRATAL